MLIAKPTKFGAGITLVGDTNDLLSLRETVHLLAAESGPLASFHGEYALALAYELRKASAGLRERWDKDNPVYSNYFAVNILWPEFLIQVGMLRAACAYVPTSRSVQAQLYLLEACTESALLELDPVVGALCMRWLSIFTLFPDAFLIEFVVHQTRSYVYDTPAGKQRFRRLPNLLHTISPLSDEYLKFERAVAAQAHAESVRAQDLADWSNWPAFKW